MKSLFSLICVGLFLSSTLFISGCLKGDFDAPPTNIPEIKDEQIISFDKMFEKLAVGKVTNFAEDKYLEALIVADDKSGNFYKNLVLHDTKTDRGITISIDENELNALYPVGQIVFVALKDLAIGYFEGLPTLGVNSGNSVGRIPAGLVRSVLIRAGRTAAVTPRKVAVTDLSSKHYSTLIELEGMQFETATASTTYADPTPADPQSVNHNVANCQGQKLVLRNSGFASFAGQTVPSGNGKLVAVYSYYRSAAQLFIRDTDDLTFTGERCSGTGGGGGTTGDQVRIEALRSQFFGTAVPLTKGWVKGIVISDAVNKNINVQNMVVQDGDFGIVLRFKSAISVPLGTEVKVGLTGGSLSEFNGLLQVQNLENTNVEALATGKTVNPKVLTVAQIDLAKHESTLIKIENATLTGGSKFSDNIKVKDASGEVSMFTLNAATFSGNALPTGTVSVTAIASEFTSGKQLNVRSASDISGGGPCDVTVATADCDGDGVQNSLDCAPSNAAIYPGGPCDDGNAATVSDQYDTQCVCKGSAPGAGLNETFTGQAADKDIDLSGWANVAVKGNRKWQAKIFSGNTYAQATAFGTTAPADMESWLISPVINTGSAGTLSFETAKAFYKHDGLTVWVTTNYTNDPSNTSWTQINAKVAGSADADNAFIPSGNINLKSYGANVRVGFKYVGTQAANTTTYRVDNVIVK